MADQRPLVYIVIYSLFRHVYDVSLAVREGLEAKGVRVKLFQVQETLSNDILTKMKAPEKPDIPEITVDMLVEPDAIIFGLPTRFGIFPAQVKSLLDASGSLWAKGALAGKFAGVFFSTASQHGGQETTALTAITYFAHHGMMYIPFGFADPNLFDNSEVIGGSAYGAGTVAGGDGARQPTEAELQIARTQGENFANILNTFANGKQKRIQSNSSRSQDITADESLNTTTSQTIPSSTDSTAAKNATALGAAAGAAVAGAAVVTAANTNNSTTVTDPDAIGSKQPISNSEATVSPDGIQNTLDTNTNDSTVAGAAPTTITETNEVLPDPAVAVGTGTTAPATISKTVGDPVPDSNPAETTTAATTTAATTATTTATTTAAVTTTADTTTAATIPAEQTKPEVVAAAQTAAKPTVTTEPKKKKKPWFCCG